MGRYVVKLPDIGEGMTEAEIVAWHVKPLSPALSPRAGRGRAAETSPRVPSPRARGEGRGEGQAAERRIDDAALSPRPSHAALPVKENRVGAATVAVPRRSSEKPLA